ncbi:MULTISPECIES: DUF1203 domain-containing protein [Kitasatospora]|uniref:DUF1203 domain-containing protein n=1 Tax=Kitasatospora setae (strain ATCC 33774 / DSM 43861 / JCM 3304 / KCC A-0304 / NBRC 14216 / KM-6054) TaxID=452652 RepID=E4NG80_KITSK|nr:MULTISPECIES: DUF1203 domain-containing protein [Kitasatospora]BAJ30510.1 hypothetical protein KSE_47300 [Kitasatospora setae KM-6054]
MDVRAVPAEVLAGLRRADDAGRARAAETTEAGGHPLRCCLTRARPGDRIVLLSYAPLLRWAAETGCDPGPYLETGPVFVHAEPCAGHPGGWPAGFHGGHRVLRAYSADGRILGGRIGEPEELPLIAAELLADPANAVLHVRAVEYGCFLHEVRRA